MLRRAKTDQPYRLLGHEQEMGPTEGRKLLLRAFSLGFILAFTRLDKQDI